MAEEPGWQLVLAFPDGSASFCYGFEAGRIWERMRRFPHDTIDEVVSDENRELYSRMAQSADWTIAFEPVNNDGWERIILHSRR